MKIEISTGELVDKITILKIKKRMITDDEKLINVNTEYNALLPMLAECGVGESDQLFIKLQAVNQQLWDIEDKLRKKEKLKEFDADFIELARSVYHINDVRSEIKREVNELTGSMIIEEKHYEKYSDRSAKH